MIPVHPIYRIEALTTFSLCTLVLSLTWLGWWWWMVIPGDAVYNLARFVTLGTTFIGATIGIGIGNWYSSAEADRKAKFKKESEIRK